MITRRDLPRGDEAITRIGPKRNFVHHPSPTNQ
jgi:hypothetical protein